MSWHRLPAGSTLHLLAGRAVLHEPPAWLAERMVARRVVLHAGESHRLAQGGWVRLDAGPAAAWRIEAPAEPLRRALAPLLARLRAVFERGARPVSVARADAPPAP